MGIFLKCYFVLLYGTKQKKKITSINSDIQNNIFNKIIINHINVSYTGSNKKFLISLDHYKTGNITSDRHKFFFIILHSTTLYDEHIICGQYIRLTKNNVLHYLLLVIIFGIIF